MSESRRGRRGRQRINRPIEMRSDASLSEYFSFFWSLPARQNSAVSWEESQYLDSDKGAFGDCDNEQDIEINWGSSRFDKAMDDQAAVAVDDDKSSFAALTARFSGVETENGNSQSLASGSLSTVQGAPGSSTSSTVFHDAKGAAKSNNGAKQLCVICGGSANGYHFGALSCAACNAFFRRSVAESRKYFCRKSGRCIIDQAARCFCRACRLKKCLECGMDPNAVQPHRDMIGQKRKRSLSDHREDSVNSGISMETSSSSDIKTPRKEELLKNTASTADTCSKSVADEGLSSDHQCKAASIRQTTDICQNDVSKRPKYNESATAHLLTSTNVIAESLIAFSRTPLISPVYNDVSNGRLDTELCAQTNTEDKTEVRHAISTVKFSSRVPMGNENVKSYEQSPFSSSLVEAVEAPRNFAPDWFTNEVPSSSADWAQGTESSSIFWNTTAANAAAATATSVTAAAAAATQHEKIRSPSVPASDYDPSKNTIEVLVDAYRRLRERRRLLFCPPTLRDMLGGTEAPLRSVPLGAPFQSLVRMDAGLLIEFFNMVHPFPKLRLDDRIKLVRNAGVAYSLMEKFYVTMRGGGFQTNRVINNDNSYHDLAFSDEEGDEQENAELPFVDGADSDKKTKNDYRTVKRLLLPLIRDSMRDIAGAMYHSGMTDVEFVALTVIILLDHTTPNLSDLARRLVKEERDHLYLDWFAYYEAHNISDGPQRVGNALLLLPAIYVTSKKQAESYYLVRLFNLFEITSLIDDIMK